MLDETPLFFANGAYSLFGVLHRPIGPGVMRGAFVFCHPFGEEKLWTHRVFVSFARRLAADGFAVLRFDFMGNGDSEGNFSDATMATARADVVRAIQEIRRLTGTKGVSLLGLRLGATIASSVAEETEGVQTLVLWAPITDGERYMQDLLRINVTTQLAAFKQIRHERSELVAAMRQGQTVNVDGYELTLALFSGVSDIKLASEPRAFDRPCLIVHIDREARPATDLQRLAGLYRLATVKFAQEDPFWKEIPRSYQRDPANLFAVTQEWLEAQPAAGGQP